MAFIYSILPEYTHLSDKYNEYSLYGEYSTLKGYTDAIDETVFEILRSSIREILSFNDVYSISEYYLPYFSCLLGYKWNDYIDSYIQRVFLANILQLYKRKGTIFSFDYMLYNIDPNVNITEPYKQIFRLNSSKMNSKSYLPSRNYYSYGIISISMNNVIPEIYEIIESIRPAGWRFIIERRLEAFTDMNLKPRNEKPRTKVFSNVFINSNKDDAYQYQMENSIHYSLEKMLPLTIYGRTFTAENLLTINHIYYHSLIEPKLDLGYNTIFRFGAHSSFVRPHYAYLAMKGKLTAFVGTIFTRNDEYNYEDLREYFENRIEEEKNFQAIEYNDSNLNSHLLINSIHYGYIMSKDMFRRIEFNKVPVLSRQEFTFYLDSACMKRKIKDLKYYTLNSFDHVFANDIKVNRYEEKMEGYSLARITNHHFTRRLV